MQVPRSVPWQFNSLTLRLQVVDVFTPLLESALVVKIVLPSLASILSRAKEANAMLNLAGRV